MIYVKDNELTIIKNILKKYLDFEDKILVYGSRIDEKHKQFSDIDIAIVSDKLDILTLFNMKHDFSESDLPYFVDITDYNNTADYFKKIIDSNNVKLSI
ncbi:MAG: nucleotidyltransferase domain-containing protein [Ruminococcus sp.]|jgi:predicted nucleotidyltransferase|nr:nucleotidyltransferase domain-containing protein [Ruminococcus sp.]